MIRFIIIEAAAESSGPWQMSNPVSVPAELSFGKVGCSFGQHYIFDWRKLRLHDRARIPRMH